MRLLVLLALIPATVSAQNTQYKPVLCADTKSVVETLTNEEYKENPVWMGTDDSKHNFGLFVNKTTGGWTLVEFRGRAACVLGAGRESHINEEAFKKDNL